MTNKYYDTEKYKRTAAADRAHYKRHGGPYDRGSADAYYGRRFSPHYYIMNNMMFSERVEEDGMTSAEIQAYTDGYDEQVESGIFKDWG